jgi:hypothetical protein
VPGTEAAGVAAAMIEALQSPQRIGKTNGISAPAPWQRPAPAALPAHPARPGSLQSAPPQGGERPRATFAGAGQASQDGGGSRLRGALGAGSWARADTAADPRASHGRHPPSREFPARLALGGAHRDPANLDPEAVRTLLQVNHDVRSPMKGIVRRLRGAAASGVQGV